MDVATLVIAVLGLALSVAALVWQAVTFALSGGRAHAVLKVGALTPDGASLVSARQADVDTQWSTDIARQGFSRPVVAIEVRSIGRLPVTVARWGLRSSEGPSLYPVANVEAELAGDVAIGPALPHRLDVGESATWLLDRQSVDPFLQMHHELLRSRRRPASTLARAVDTVRRREVFGVVELADGHTRKTRDVL